jgi:hypothetical protein
VLLLLLLLRKAAQGRNMPMIRHEESPSEKMYHSALTLTATTTPELALLYGHNLPDLKRINYMRLLAVLRSTTPRVSLICPATHKDSNSK